MRKNLSEELVINDVIKLGVEEDEEVSTQPDKETEKKINKELADKVKDVEEINDAKTPDLGVKIKGLTEKLVLEEPSDMLNEDINPYSYDAYSDAVSDLTNIVKRFLERTNDVPHEDAIQMCYDAFEEAIDNSLEENLEEEVLDEKIPKDLAKAYKNANPGMYKGLPNADLQNATYDEVSPEAGYKAYKNDPQSVRLLFGNRLIDFEPNGHASLEHRDTWLPRDKWYTNRNGKVVKDTKYIPPKDLFRLADKIYITNENTPEGKKNAELMKQRAENPESPNVNYENNPRNTLQSYDNTGVGWNERRGSTAPTSVNKSAYNKRMLNRYDNEIANYRQWLEDPTLRPSYYTENEVKEKIKNLEKRKMDFQGEVADNAARLRYANSEKNLQKPFVKYKEIKNNLSSLSSRAERAKDELNKARQFGSPASQENKRRLKDLNDDLAEVLRKIALIELELEETDEEDAAAVAEAERKYNDAYATYTNAKGELDALLRRN